MIKSVIPLKKRFTFIMSCGIVEGSRTHNGLKCHFCPSLRYLHREIRPVCPCASALIWTKIAILNFCEPKGTDFVIENGSRSEGIPGVFQATRVVLCAKAVLLGVMGSILFGYSRRAKKLFGYNFTTIFFFMQLYYAFLHSTTSLSVSILILS